MKSRILCAVCRAAVLDGSIDFSSLELDECFGIHHLRMQGLTCTYTRCQVWGNDLRQPVQQRAQQPFQNGGRVQQPVQQPFQQPQQRLATQPAPPRLATHPDGSYGHIYPQVLTAGRPGLEGNAAAPAGAGGPQTQHRVMIPDWQNSRESMYRLAPLQFTDPSQYTRPQQVSLPPLRHVLAGQPGPFQQSAAFLKPGEARKRRRTRQCPWTLEDWDRAKKMRMGYCKLPYWVIGEILGRSEYSVVSKFQYEGIRRG